MNGTSTIHCIIFYFHNGLRSMTIFIPLFHAYNLSKFFSASRIKVKLFHMAKFSGILSLILYEKKSTKCPSYSDNVLPMVYAGHFLCGDIAL